MATATFDMGGARLAIGMLPGHGLEVELVLR